MDFELAVVVNKAQLTKLIHEMADARAGGTDHLSQCLLADLCDQRLWTPLVNRFGPIAVSAGR
jgi:hypothetical protein